MKIDIVVGANYGDEGKGHVTNYLASNSNGNAAVVRYNGGAQAGHTVEANGLRHVFKHFGSGTLSGIPTILSEKFIVNPILLFKEAEVLSRLGVEDVMMFASEDAILTTPYDVYVNQELETSRGKKNHGSCGMGINETVNRSLLNDTRLTLKDFVDGNYDEILDTIENEWFPARLKVLGLEVVDIKTHPLLSTCRERFVNDTLEMLELVEIFEGDNAYNYFDHLVFEGAQGLRLDADSIDFPHVTNSKTGFVGASSIIKTLPFDEIHVHYLTRSYLTRHGAGPLVNECELDIKDKTNKKNQFQGHLRFSKDLGVERLKSDIEKDIAEAEIVSDCIRKTLVVTWCDEYGKVSDQPVEAFIEELSTSLQIDSVLTSWGPDVKDFDATQYHN